MLFYKQNKKIYSDKRFTNFKMPYMMMLTSVGEPTSKGEEKFINKCFYSIF